MEKKIAPINTYPTDGLHTDGYWYVRKELPGPIINDVILTSTTKTVSIESISFYDNLENNAVNLFRFSIGSNASNWISNQQYIFNSLNPNTMYTVKSAYKNEAGNTAAYEENIYTKAQLPTLTIDNLSSTTIELKVISENPEYTKYQVICDSKYVDSSGLLTTTPSWIIAQNNIIKISGIASNIYHSIKIKAKNIEEVETDFSNLIEVNKHTIVPSNLTAATSSTSIQLIWDRLPEVYEYDIEADGIIKTVKTTSYTHKGLIPNIQHSYRVRARNLYGVSNWSPVTIAITSNSVPENILNIKAYPSNTAASLTWDEAKNAEYYEIEFDGTVINNVKSSFHTIVGLNPVTQYTYRIRAINAAGEGSWSDYSTVTTYLLSTPMNIKTVEEQKEIKITWDVVDKVSEYEIEINGQAPIAVSANSYEHTDITEETQYVYRIRGKNTQGESAWSNPLTVTTLPVRPKIPTRFRAFTDENIVTLSWDAVDQAIGYDVELDGVLIDNGDSKIYLHEDLTPTTIHKYRVRAKNAAVEGEWAEYIIVKTMAGKPVVPMDIKVETTPTITTLSWKTEEEALGYDIEVDGKIIDNITSTSYRHRRIIPLTEHVYRIRTRNITGISPWSGYMINNSIKALCKKGNEVDLGLTASDIIDFSKYTLTVAYNPDVIEVTDLCTLSSRIELGKGNIEGTGITITEYIPGKIVFVVDKSIPPGECWTGVINSIKFIARVTGGTNITYTVFGKPEE